MTIPVRPGWFFIYKIQSYIMAKDPAFLFYPGDWLGGTMGMTLEEKGAYLELLVMQWNCRRITNDAAKRLVGSQIWQKLAHKFESDGSGFFNKRLEEEVIKRRKHSEKQAINANKRWHKDECGGIANAMPLENENENINEIEIKDRVVGEGWNTKPGKEYLNLELDKTKGGAVIQLFKFSKNHNLTEVQLELLWGIFKAQNFNGEKYYASKNEVFSHFINWSKTQNVTGNGKSSSTTKTNGSSYKTAGQDAYAERLKRQLSELKP